MNAVPLLNEEAPPADISSGCGIKADVMYGAEL